MIKAHPRCAEGSEKRQLKHVKHMELLLLPLPYLVHSDLYGHFHGLSAHLKTLNVTSRPEHMKAWPPTGTPGNAPVTNVPRILDLEWTQDARA